ncbi:hypothetical protein AAHA92_10690 [Salvia divinorum]|uniref:Secreted protein n=1 Tax=Salvia divinorum TaxID=28513 RepID=A0ABD1HVH1_SALDI
MIAFLFLHSHSPTLFSLSLRLNLGSDIGDLLSAPVPALGELGDFFRPPLRLLSPWTSTSTSSSPLRPRLTGCSCFQSDFGGTTLLNLDGVRC